LYDCNSDGQKHYTGIEYCRKYCDKVTGIAGGHYNVLRSFRDSSQQLEKFMKPIVNQAHEPVQALADISLSALCCHSNETRAPIAIPPSSAVHN